MNSGLMKWVKEKYAGQTTDELLALASKYSPSAVIFKIERGLDLKWERLGFESLLEQILDHAFGRVGKGILNEEEMAVLAIVSLQREVHNGGFHQLFVNHLEFTPILEHACLQIGRGDIADVTREAVNAIGFDRGRLVEGRSYLEEFGTALRRTNKERDHKLYECDGRFYDLEKEPNILRVSLFNFIKANKDKIILPP
jgi:hypothetical protein